MRRADPSKCYIMMNNGKKMINIISSGKFLRLNMLNV